MSYWIVALILPVAGLVALVINGRRERKRIQQPIPELPIPTFKVVAVGISGSGKTVLLASLFSQFRIAADRTYYLDSDPATKVRLGSILTQVADPTVPWPDATARAETKTYTFDCVANVGGTPTSALKIEYLDYAGEIFETEGQNSTAVEELFDRISQADALIGVLDGRRVRQYLRGEGQGVAYMFTKINSMVLEMAKARCPIYLVVSKWDLVRDFGEPVDASDNARLELVSQALMRVPSLNGLVYTRGGLVRLIPVSAVGPDFARLDDASGRVDKLSTGTFAPYNTEIPIAALIPDLFRRVERNLNQEMKDTITSEYLRRQNVSPEVLISELGSLLLRPAGAALRTAVAGTINRPYSDEFLGMALDWVAGPSQRRQTELDAFWREATSRTSELWYARSQVVSDFARQVDHWQANLPASVLPRTDA